MDWGWAERAAAELEVEEAMGSEAAAVGWAW